MGAMVGTGRGGRGGRGGGPRAAVLGRGHPCRGVRDIVCRAPPPCVFFLGFGVFNHPPTLMVTEPWSIQVAWSRSMSWCRVLLMVPHVRRWVVSSGAGHPVSMRGIVAFASAEFMMFRDGYLLWVPVAVFLAGMMLWRGTRLPWRGWRQDGSGCQVGAGRSPYRAQVYTVYAVPLVSACSLYMDFRALP